MKMHSKSILFLAGISFIVSSGCKKTDGLVSAPPADYGNVNKAVSVPSQSNQPVPVTITMKITGGTFPTLQDPLRQPRTLYHRDKVQCM